MAYVMTYDSLLEDLRGYLERGQSASTDPTVYQQFPRLIALAEKQISTELISQGLLTAVTTTMVVGDNTFAKPDRWRETVSMNILTDSGRVQLFPRSYEYCRDYWPDSSVNAQPLFYADYDYANWIFSPSPDDTYTLEILYYELPQPIDDFNQTSWLTAFAPDLLLYCALTKAAPMLKNDERVQVWESLYNRALQAYSAQDLKRITDRSAYRTED